MNLYVGGRAHIRTITAYGDIFLMLTKNEKMPIELFDKEIAEPGALELLGTLASVAMECLNLDIDERPAMTDVAEHLLMLKRSRN